MNTLGRLTNEKHYISISMRSVATKLDTVVDYDKELEKAKSHVLLISWSLEGHVTNKNRYIFTSARHVTTKRDTG